MIDGGASPIGRASESEVLLAGLVEPQRPPDRSQHVGRRVDPPTLLEPRVPRDRDAGEQRHLLPPQARGAPAPAARQPDLLGRHRLAPGAQERGQLGALLLVGHLRQSSTPGPVVDRRGYLAPRTALFDAVGYVVAASIAFAVGGALMKLAAGAATVLPTLGVAVLFVAGGLLLGEAVRVQGLSVAYIAGLGIEAVMSVGIGRYVFNERLSGPQAVGLLLIAAGIASVRFG